jgi:hypothetical protein
MRTLNDGGAIYTLGGQGDGDGSATSTLSGNLLVGSSGASGGAQGIYHDEGSSYWNSHDNVVSQIGTNWNQEWISTIHDIAIHDNYTDTSRYLNNGTNVTVTNTTLVSNGAWPQAARDIAAQAGLEAAYRTVMPPSAYLANDGDLGGLSAPATVAYSGSWTVAGQRGYGDLSADVHATGTDGDSVTVTFTGTGLRVLGERNSDQGRLGVTLDGAAAGTVDTSTTGPRQAQAVVYQVENLPYGSHTVKLTKSGGSFATVDGLLVDRSVNDTDPSLTYSGTWGHQAGRGFGDYQDDVHYTTHDGDSVTATFTGTGADVVTETNSDEGTLAVYVDGQSRGTVDAGAAGRSGQQRVYTVDGLSYGQHTVRLVKTGGTYLLVDRLTYR